MSSLQLHGKLRAWRLCIFSPREMAHRFHLIFTKGCSTPQKSINHHSREIMPKRSERSRKKEGESLGGRGGDPERQRLRQRAGGPGHPAGLAKGIFMTLINSSTVFSSSSHLVEIKPGAGIGAGARPLQLWPGGWGQDGTSQCGHPRTRALGSLAPCQADFSTEGPASAPGLPSVSVCPHTFVSHSPLLHLCPPRSLSRSFPCGGF